MRIFYLFLLVVLLSSKCFSVELSSSLEVEFSDAKYISDFSINIDNDMVNLFAYINKNDQPHTTYFLKANSYDNDLNPVGSNESDTVEYFGKYHFTLKGAYTNSKNTRYYIFHTGSDITGDTLYIDNTILDTNLNYVHGYEDSLVYDPSNHTFAYNGTVGFVSYSRSKDKIRIDEYLTSLKYKKTNYTPSHNFTINYEDSDSVKHTVIGQGGLFDRELLYYSVVYNGDSLRSSGAYIKDYSELKSHRSYGNLIAEKVAIANKLNIYTVFRKKNTISKTIYILYKTDDQNSVKWKKEFGYGNSDNIYDLEVDTENNAYILMHSKNKFKILKFSESGDKVWEYELDVNDLEYSSVRPKSLDILSGDELLVSYYIKQNGTEKILLEKYNKLTGFKSYENFSPILQVYPNPAQDYIKLDLKDRENVSEIKIFNSLGEVVKSVDAISSGKIDISGLSPGIYFVRVGKSVEKFVKW